MNVSIIMSTESRMGTCNFTTGLYDGAIGIVQRGEADAFFMPLRYDSTPCEPGFFIPSIQGENIPRIFSTRNYTNGNVTNRQEIIYLVTSFNDETWTYFICSFLIPPAIVTMISPILKRIKIKKRLIVYHYCKSLWQFFMLLVDLAPTTIGEAASQSILWTSMVLAAFYAFHCVFFNTLASDLSVPPQVKYIDTLSDLLNNTRFNVTPVVLKQMATLDVLERYRNGTPEKQLYEKLVSNCNESCIEIDFEMVDDSVKMAELAEQFMDKIINGSVAVIHDSSLFIHCLSHMFCHYKYPPVVQIMKNMKVSKESFGTGPQATLISKFADPVQLELYSYIDTLNREHGAMKGWRRRMGDKEIRQANQMMMGSDQAFSSSGFECADRILGTSPLVESMAKKVEREEGFNPMGMKFFRSLIIICIIMIFMATYVLIFEILYHSSEKVEQIEVVRKSVILRTRSNELNLSFKRKNY